MKPNHEVEDGALLSCSIAGILIALAAIVILTGCASSVGGNAALQDQNITTEGEPSKSQLIVSNQGVTGNNNGIAPSGFLLDQGGAYAGMPGPAALFNVNKSAETINLVTPNDGSLEVENLVYQDFPSTGTLLTADRFRMEIRITENIEQQRLTYESAEAIIVSVAEDQRRETIEQWEAAGRITANVAAELIRLYVPAP